MNITGEQLRRYSVTDRAWAADRDALFRQIEDAINGGASVVQLREKHLDQAAFLAEAEQFAALCRRKGAVSIINDSVEIALKSGADGVHLGQEDLEAGSARRALGPDRILGVSAHNVEEALRAQAAGADYLGVGAAFISGTKADARPISRETIRAITAAVDIPVVAIGGITRDNILELKNCGLDGAAVVSALFAQPNVRDAASELRQLCDKIAEEDWPVKTALTIAGTDPTGGAGIQADIKTMTANGVFAMSAVTALVAQNTTGVKSIVECTPAFLGEQLDCVFTDIFPDAVKTGMVSSTALIEVIADKLSAYGTKNLVVDPVMVATSGDRLISEDAVEALKARLLPMAAVITPNIPEAELLSGRKIQSVQDMEDAARAIYDSYGCAVLCKGGHNLNDANDLLWQGGGGQWFRGRRIDNPNTHGTGCTLSSAIASNLAKGYGLAEAVERAKTYLSGALGAMLDLGRGPGPMNHAFDIKPAYRKTAD